MGKTGPSRKLKNHDLQKLILGYVRQFGTVDGCANDVDGISIRTVYYALNKLQNNDKPNPLYIPEFAAKVQQAKEDYQALHRHPKDDPNIQRDAYKQFGAGVAYGQSNVQEFEYYPPESPFKGKLKRKIFTKPGLERWEWEVLHPKQEFTQDAVLIVTANQYADLIENEQVDPATREIILKWLVDWKRRATEELNLKGLNTKYLEPGRTS